MPLYKEYELFLILDLRKLLQAGLEILINIRYPRIEAIRGLNGETDDGNEDTRKIVAIRGKLPYAIEGEVNLEITNLSPWLADHARDKVGFQPSSCTDLFERSNHDSILGTITSIV